MTPKEEYLATIARLSELRQNLPHVSHEFMVRVASMPTEELQRRLLICSDWVGAFHACLDGIEEIKQMNGASMDGCRDPRTIRRIVERLIRSESVANVRSEPSPICLCSACGTNVFVGDDLVENKVYKSGELSYISLTHRRCVEPMVGADATTESKGE